MMKIEKRKEGRYPIYEGDSLYAMLRREDGSVFGDRLRVMDISDSGLRLKIPKVIWEREKGSGKLLLERLIHAEKEYSYGFEVAETNCSLKDDDVYVGFSLNYPRRDTQRKRVYKKDNRRSIERIRIPKKVVAYAFCMHPVFIGMRMCFRIEDISTQGTLLRVIEGSICLLNKRSLDEVTIVLQGRMPFSVKARVQYINKGDSVYLVALKFLDMKRDDCREIEYFIYNLHSKNQSVPGKVLTTLRRKGYKLRDLSGLVKLRFAQTREDREAVFVQRYSIYSKSGWIEPNLFPGQQFEEEYDKHSKLLMALLGNRLVGSVRCEFRSNGFSSVDKYLNLDELLNCNQNILIVTRLVIEEAYRSKNIIAPLLLKVFEYAEKQNINCWFSTSQARYIKAYAKLLGYRIVGPPFKAYHGMYDYPIVVNYSYNCRPALFPDALWNQVYHIGTDNINRQQIFDRF